ncbi:MAG: efflux RND transporter permease subunit [Acidobacteria bacterium]|nr:efflux RND transporter permease subunit [Acidobacteriota bacterium]
MKLVEASIKYPVSVTVGVLFVVLFGFLALFRIPVQMIPDIEEPQVFVSTAWPGASPAEVETEIVQEQEEQLKTLEGLVRMTSSSSQSLGAVVLRFQTGSDIDAAMLRVNNALQQVPSYPRNALKPVLSTSQFGGAEGAIAWFLLRSADGSDIRIAEQRDFVEEVIKARLERVPGVSASGLFGGRERELRVDVDVQALVGRGLTLSQLGQALDTENRDVSAGDFDEGKRSYVVRTVGRYASPRDVENVVLAWRDGAPVYVKDVARVGLGFKDPDQIVRNRGIDTIAVNASRQLGSNTIVVMDGLRDAVAELNAGPLAERNMVMEVAFAQSDYIEGAIALVQRNIFVGGVLAIAVLLLFLRTFSSTLVIALAIPVSIIGTFLAMALLGRNINVVSLAGLAFAVGMIVDASIVVLENIYRHQQLGKRRRQAAYDGAREVWGAVLASVLTTVAVFLPVFFVQEKAGQLFRDIAVAVSAAVLISLVVSITLIPSLAARVLSATSSSKDLEATVEDEVTERRPRRRRDWRHLWGIARLGQGAAEGFGDFVYAMSGSVAARLALVVVLAGGAIVLAYGLVPATEYLPSGNQNFIQVILVAPAGYHTDEYVSIAERIEGSLRPYWEAQPSTPEAAALDGPPIDQFFFVAGAGFVFMGSRVHPDEVENAYQLIPVMQRAIGGIPGTIGIVQQSSIFDQGPTSSRGINIDLAGPDLERLLELGKRVFGSVLALIPGAQLQPIPGLELGNPEVRVLPDRERAAEVGFTAQELGFTLNALIDGVKVSEYQYEGRAIDLVLRGQTRYRDHRTQDIENLVIATPSGGAVTIGDVARVVATSGPQQINRIERQRAITIRVTPPREVAIETAMTIIENDILGPMRADGSLAPPYSATLSGAADELTETRRALQENFILAVLVTYLLMAALFESFVYPFVILFSVPFAAVGGFLGLAAVNKFVAFQSLDVVAMLGFVILVGIVVNNAILIVHQTLNYMRERGLAHRDALREAVSDRLRPIFMSTMTSVIGMAPLVLITGPGSEIYRGLGSVVVGGLLVSTVFTLLLVPAVFSLTMDAREWFHTTFTGKTRSTPDPA